MTHHKPVKTLILLNTIFTKCITHYETEFKLQTFKQNYKLDRHLEDIKNTSFMLY